MRLALRAACSVGSVYVWFVLLISTHYEAKSVKCYALERGTLAYGCVQA